MKRNHKLIGLILLFIVQVSVIRIYGMNRESKSNIVYELNGKKVLENREVFREKENIYLLSEDIEDILGVEIEVDDNTINIKHKIGASNEEIANINLEKAIVVDIEVTGKKITVLPCSRTEESKAYITINVNEKTEIFYEEINKIVPINMIEKNMIISVNYNVLADQGDQKNYIATHIIIKGDRSTDEEQIPIIEGIEIIEINTLKGYIKVGYSEKNKEQIENQIIIHIDQNTNIIDEQGQPANIQDLKLGQKIKIRTNGILTASLPPQTLGLEIIILGK